MQDLFESNFTNFKKNLDTRLPNASESLKGNDVGLKFQCKMFEFMDCVNQETQTWQE